MTLDTPPTMKHQLAYVGLLFVSLAAIGIALYALIASFRYFDIDVAFWYYFGGFVFVALLGLLGLELSTARIKTM